MVSKQEVLDFLDSLVYRRMNKVGLELELENFFHIPITLTGSTEKGCKEIDYSFITTTTTEEGATNNFIDIEIYYLKMRKDGHFFITECVLLDYVE